MEISGLITLSSILQKWALQFLMFTINLGLFFKGMHSGLVTQVTKKWFFSNSVLWKETLHIPCFQFKLTTSLQKVGLSVHYAVFLLMWYWLAWQARVIAVLDWELSTLGNQMSDIAYNCLVSIGLPHQNSLALWKACGIQSNSYGMSIHLTMNLQRLPLDIGVLSRVFLDGMDKHTFRRARRTSCSHRGWMVDMFMVSLIQYLELLTSIINNPNWSGHRSPSDWSCDP